MTETASQQRTATRIRQVRLGFAKTVPLLLGVFPFGIAYGVLAVQTGLSVFETMLMSAIVFAGGSQFLAVGMMASGVGGVMIVVSTLLVNLRHLVMGLSISPYLAESSPWWQRMAAFAMTDESYLVSITHYRDQGQVTGSPAFLLGSGLAIYVSWGIGSLIGALFGSAIADPAKFGLDFMMSVTFVTMLLPELKSARLIVVAAVSAAVATATYILVPGKWYIIIAVVAATLTGVLFEAIAEKKAAR